MRKTGWQVKELSAVSAINYGYTESATSEPVGPRFLRITDIQDDRVKWDSVPYCKIETSEIPKFRLNNGDIVFARTGATTGKSFLLQEPPDAVFASYLIRLRLLDKTLLPEFVYLFFQTAGYWKSVKDGSSGSAQGGFNASKLGALSIPIPPLAEQQRIVGILDEAFDGIAAAKANAEQNLQNARALFESHLQSVFTQAPLSGVEGRGEGWDEKPLSELCDIKHGFAFEGTEFSSDVPEGKPIVITPGNFTEDGKLLFNEKNTKRFSGKPPAAFCFDIGDLVIVMTDLSSKMKILGKPAFVETDDVLHNQRIGRVIFFDDSVEKRFVYYFMMSEGFLKNIKMSATGTMVKHTAPSRILSNVISFPVERKEQMQLVAKLDSLREETQRLESLYQRKLAALDELKKSLLHQAFSGAL